jgi:hypothetical protein
MKAINYALKVAHFEELAGRAAYAAHVALCPVEREQWEARAARYDEQVAAYRALARRAA